jgi:hypothetical protein
MPRWARFLSCSFTGWLLIMVGFIMSAYWFEGGATYWESLLAFLTTPGFYGLVLLFALMAAIMLVVSRIAVNLYGFGDALAGGLSGALMAVVYAAFLIANYQQDWGGLAIALQRAWPAAFAFAAPFALSGAFTTWLWDRLD